MRFPGESLGSMKTRGRSARAPSSLHRARWGPHSRLSANVPVRTPAGEPWTGRYRRGPDPVSQGSGGGFDLKANFMTISDLEAGLNAVSREAAARRVAWRVHCEKARGPIPGPARRSS